MEIKITKHALEEFIKDNPKTKKPQEVLRSKFIKFLKLAKSKKLTRAFFSKTEPSIMGYGDEVIVYQNYIIITYYIIFSKQKYKIDKVTKNKINKVLNGKKEMELIAKRNRKIIRENNKMSRYTVFNKFKR